MFRFLVVGWLASFFKLGGSPFFSPAPIPSHSIHIASPLNSYVEFNSTREPKLKVYPNASAAEICLYIGFEYGLKCELGNTDEEETVMGSISIHD